MTVLDYLKVDLDHDREHLAELNELLGELRSQVNQPPREQ
jgi:hypothetical protein